MTTKETIQIDTDIPLPTKAVGRRGLYPWDALDVGHSFFAPGRRAVSPPRRLKDDGREFTSEQRTENDVEGVRVWRTA